MGVQYNPYVAVAKVGDYLLSDLTFGSEIGSKTPIAVCVAPASHFQDGKARWISLVNMSLTDPEHGTVATGNDSSNPGAAIVWGNTVGIGTLSTKMPTLVLPEVNKPTTELKSTPSDKGYVSSDYFNSGNIGTAVVDPFNSALHYYGNGSDMDGTSYGAIPSPFKSDGSLNPINRLYALSEENGYALTNAIIEAATATETEGAIKNSSSAGHFPAAMACHRFTAGISDLAGQWYLPSACELVYVMTHISLLNTKLTAVGDSAVCVGDRATKSTLGDSLCSSSEYSSSGAWTLYTDNGSLYDSPKSMPRTGSRIRAFLAL